MADVHILFGMPRPPRARNPLKLAALELFVEQGVHATGIRDIAKRAKCSEAALYRHWKSKDELVRAVFMEHLEEVCAILDEAINGAEDLPDKVRAASAAAYRLYDEQPLVFRFVLLVQHEMARALPGDLRMPLDVVMGMTRAAVAKRQAEGDPDLLAVMVVGIFLETAVGVLYGRLPSPLSRHAGAVAEACLRVMQSPAASPVASARR
jgi:AcrR family transcriptional regulator